MSRMVPAPDALIAKQITPAISQDDDALAAQDASTQSLIKFYRANREF